MAVLLWKSSLMLDILFQRYRSERRKYATFYENELSPLRIKPLNLLQVGVDSSIAVWHKFLQNSNIYCIDEFKKKEPKIYDYLNEKRVFWSRCDTSEEKAINEVMKNVWNNPRFDIIIDTTNNFAYTRQPFLKRFSTGKYYIEDGDDVMIIK